MLFGVGSRAVQLVGQLFLTRWILPHDYGATMAALYVAFTAGVIAAACLATRSTRSAIAVSLAALGFAAACALDFELHDEAERVLPFGLLFGPYIAWALAWLALRSQPAPAAAAQ